MARSLVSGPRRRPSPPARIITRTRAVSKGAVLRNGPELKTFCGIGPEGT
ncbi:MAG: hypothetical protein QM820_20930 [Minicystis sp.]